MLQQPRLPALAEHHLAARRAAHHVVGLAASVLAAELAEDAPPAALPLASEGLHPPRRRGGRQVILSSGSRPGKSLVFIGNRGWMEGRKANSKQRVNLLFAWHLLQSQFPRTASRCACYNAGTNPIHLRPAYIPCSYFSIIDHS